MSEDRVVDTGNENNGGIGSWLKGGKGALLRMLPWMMSGSGIVALMMILSVAAIAKMLKKSKRLGDRQLGDRLGELNAAMPGLNWKPLPFDSEHSAKKAWKVLRDRGFIAERQGSNVILRERDMIAANRAIRENGLTRNYIDLNRGAQLKSYTFDSQDKAKRFAREAKDVVGRRLDVTDADDEGRYDVLSYVGPENAETLGKLAESLGAIEVGGFPVGRGDLTPEQEEAAQRYERGQAREGAERERAVGRDADVILSTGDAEMRGNTEVELKASLARLRQLEREGAEAATVHEARADFQERLAAFKVRRDQMPPRPASDPSRIDERLRDQAYERLSTQLSGESARYEREAAATRAAQEAVERQARADMGIDGREAPARPDPDIAGEAMAAQRRETSANVEVTADYRQARPDANRSDTSQAYADGNVPFGLGDSDADGIQDSAEDLDGDGVVDDREQRTRASQSQPWSIVSENVVEASDTVNGRDVNHGENKSYAGSGGGPGAIGAMTVSQSVPSISEIASEASESVGASRSDDRKYQAPMER